MWLKYRDIDFDYDERCVRESFIKDFFDELIDLSKDVNIYEITVESVEFAMIYIEKTGKPDAWDSETMNFVQFLMNAGYDVLYADEDYGDEFDVILIHNFDE